MWLQRMREECDELPGWECAVPQAGGWRQGGWSSHHHQPLRRMRRGGPAGVLDRCQLQWPPDNSFQGLYWEESSLIASWFTSLEFISPVKNTQTNHRKWFTGLRPILCIYHCNDVVSSFWASLDIHVRIGCQNTWSSTTDISWSLSLMQQTVDGVWMECVWGRGVG